MGSEMCIRDRYWTDDYNPPRKLNVLRAFWWTASGTVTDPALSYLELPILDAIPKAPTQPPDVYTGEWSSKKANYIKGNLWQFKYRYIYRDAQKSSWSPISESVMTRNTFSNTVVLEKDNYIEIKIINGRKDVVAIDIAARKNGIGDDFYLVGSINKDNSTQKNITFNTFGNPGIITTPTVQTTISENLPNWKTIYFIFTGEEPRIPIDLQESIKLYDDVPLLAKSQELVDGNRLTYGNIVNGYNPVPTDVKLDVVYKETTSSIGSITPFGYSVWTNADSCNWSSGINGRSHAQYTITLHCPNMASRTVGEVIHIKMSGITFASAIVRHGSMCGTEDGSRVDRIDFDSTPFVITTGTETVTDLKNHFEDNGTITFTNLQYEYSSNDAKINIGWGHGKDSHCIGDHQIGGSATYGNNGTVINGILGTIGTDDIALRFSAWNDDPMNVASCDVYDFHTVIGASGNEFINAHNSSSWGGPFNLNIPNMPIDGEHINGDGDHSTYNTFYNWNHADIYLGGYVSQTHPDSVFEFDIVNNMILIGVPILETGNYRGFKSGTRHNFGLVYYDPANRSGTVNKAGSVYIPSRHERDPAVTDYTAHIHFEIYHSPPDWATHYQWVHSSGRIEEFVQTLVPEIFWDGSVTSKYTTVLQDSQSDSSGAIEPGYQAIIETSGGLQHGAVIMDMEELIKFSSTSSESDFLWDWKKGDRVKIIDTVKLTGNDWEIIGVIEDISGKYGSNGNPLGGGKPALWFVLERGATGTVQTAQQAGVVNDVVVEVYRPVPTGEDLYHEFNHTNRIGRDTNGNRIHEANSWSCGFNEGQLSTQGYSADYVYPDGTATPTVFSYDQNDIANPTSGLPAEGTFLNGDAYIRERLFMLIFQYTQLLESYSASDFWPSKAWDLGRPNVYLPDFKQTRRDSTIFFSEPFIPNTEINGLGTFYPDISFKEYDKKFNSIQKLFSINDRLIILQEDKISFAMVSRAVLFDATGDQNVAISNNVLSSSSPYSGDFGICRNPESFTNFGFRSYFVDTKRRVVLRLSQDGLTPISEHKMKNFFTDYFQEVIENRRHIGTSMKIYGAYDNKFDEYVVCSPDIEWSTTDISTGNTINHKIFGFTVGFHEPSKRWNSFYSYQNPITTYNTELYSFKEGAVYQHNAAIDSSAAQIIGRPDPALYNNFYGVDYDSQIEFAINSLPDITKVFHSISEHANNIWELEALYTRNGQITNIFINEFTGGATYNWEQGHGTKENIHNATIRCNITTPGVVNPKIEGDRMRDTSAMCRLSLPIPQAQKQNVLFSIRFGFIPSSNPSLIENQ